MCGTAALFAVVANLPSSRGTGAAASHRPPVAKTETGAAVGATRAVVKVAVDSFGLQTRYAVQYGTGTGYTRSSSTKTVSGSGRRTGYRVRLGPLTPSTVYHYRVTATNASGAAHGKDKTFATWPVQIPFPGHGVVSKNNTTSPAAGPRANSSPLGWVMVIHGGGWQMVGRDEVASENYTVGFVTSLGWAAENVDYRKGEHSLADVLAAYDALRAEVGSQLPICLVGHSAGGNLALLVAEHRRSVACVISEAGPTDLMTFRHQKAYPTTVTEDGEVIGPEWGYKHYIVPSFGVDPKVLREWSPVHRAGAINASVLLGASTHDPWIPQRQMAELRHAMHDRAAPGGIRTRLLAGSSTPSGADPNFTHASVTSSALAKWQHEERQLLAAAASSG